MIKKIYKQLVPERKRIYIHIFINKLTSFLYRGNKYYCNCCNRSFRKFKPKGNTLIQRENAECPFCGSLERVRNLLFYIENETDLLTGNYSLLHFAPEWPLLPFFKKNKNLDHITADINPNVAKYRIDITNIPFPDNSFDYIICSHVLGHVTDEKKAIEELYRVLKIDGTALIVTLIDLKNPHTFETPEADTSQKRLYYYSEPDLLRLHGTDFSDRLAQGGFNVETINYPLVLGEEIKQKYVLGDGNRELIFKCIKN